MADISMCQDDECPSAKTCKRHAMSGTVPSEHWQAYTQFVRMPESGACPAYWETTRQGGGE